MTTSTQNLSDPNASVDRPRRRFNRRSAAVYAVVLLLGMAFTLMTALNGDVAYVLGGIETAGKGGIGIFSVFLSRPIGYGLFLDWLDHGRGLVTDYPATFLGESVVRIETDIILIVTGLILYLGLRRFWRPAAGPAAMATTVAMVIAPPWHFLAPDWVGVLGGVLTVACALAPRPMWAGAILGGFGAVSTIAVKGATAPIGVLALVLVAALSLRRALWSAAVAVVVVALWYELTHHFLPWEWIWLNDLKNLVPQSLLHRWPVWADIGDLFHALSDVTILSPVIALAPAVAVALIRRKSGARSRWRWSGYAVLVAGLAIASPFGQSEWFLYQLSVVLVLVAALWGAAYGLVPSARIPLITGTLLLTAATAILIRQPADWRIAHIAPVAIGYLVVAIAIAVWVGLAGEGRRPAVVLAAIVVALAMIPATTPGSPYAFSEYNASFPNHTPWDRSDGLAKLSERIGRDTPVLYLTFGSVNFAMGNPSTCRYPSPLWAQRGIITTSVRADRSYRDNLRCFTHDQDAQYLIWQTDWFPYQWAPQPIKGLVAEQFDCNEDVRVPAPAGIIVCPRRSAVPNQ